jgi:hypothetical protein
MRLWPRRDLHSLAGIYALDAFDSPAERERFARHLNGCQSCSSEVRGFREVATAMGFAASTTPPPELRDRVLTAAARTRQVPPEVRTHARPRRASRSAPWLPWLSGVVATASIVVAVLFGLARAHTQDELNQARAQASQSQTRSQQELNQVKAQNQALSVLLSSPGVTVLSHVTSKGGTATVVLDADRHELAVVTNGLPALPAGKVYQLWLINPHKIVSAGLLPAIEAGRTSPVLARGVIKGDELGMTVEPAPGTSQPTTTPILAVPLPV